MANPKVLERFRKAKSDLSQKDFAKQIGLSASTYQRVIDGSSPLTIEIIESAAKILKVDYNEIIKEVNEVREPEEMYNTIRRKRQSVLISVELDGTAATLKNCVDLLRRLNAAIA